MLSDGGSGGGAAWPKGRLAAAVAVAPRTRTMALPLPMLLMLLALVAMPQARANGTVSDCKFPPAWSGRWFQDGKEGPVIVNSTHFLDRKCKAKNREKYLTTEETDGTGICNRCMVFTDKHVNVLQYRECKSIPFTCMKHAIHVKAVRDMSGNITLTFSFAA
ncbi:PREDICTED: uncharacterized protein LOC105363683 [Ceratosolen solmsi marchali]|uniref:Uncharacterized protein LOC105363683 n=1 Tax=Ceratosolen solmsi marchali TaxID=326594 RepID=A0AAJ6YKH5_9HYME|nr:PREDICTED: uncharacterized protein LOC105363683 [Ceratosolen solmsi marchali]